MWWKMEILAILAIVGLDHTFKFLEFSESFDFECSDFGVLIVENMSI